MKNIFDAIRALCQNKESTERISELYQFERANRGHQNSIDEMAHARANTSLSHSTAASTLWNSTRELLFQLTWMKDTFPVQISERTFSDAYRAILSIEDKQGLLAAVTDELISQSTRFPHRPKDLFVTALKTEAHIEANGKKHLLVSMTIVYKALNLQAQRTLSIPYGTLDTLENCVRFLKAIDVACKAFSFDLPEFSTKNRQVAFAVKCRQKLNDFLEDCTEEEKTWFKKNLTADSF